MVGEGLPPGVGVAVGDDRDVLLVVCLNTFSEKSVVFITVAGAHRSDVDILAEGEGDAGEDGHLPQLLGAEGVPCTVHSATRVTLKIFSVNDYGWWDVSVSVAPVGLPARLREQLHHKDQQKRQDHHAYS